jgi:hypothetical protein
MPRRSPWTPIFNPDPRSGATPVGNTPPAIPVPSGLNFVSSIIDSTNLLSIRNIVHQGDYLYGIISGRFSVIDISSRTAPSVVGTVANSALNSASFVTVDGDYCYVAGNARVVVINVSAPSAPSIVGNTFDQSGFQSSLGTGPLVKVGNYVYVAKAGTIGIADVTSPSTPSLAATWSNANVGQYDLVLAGDGNLYNAEGATDKFTAISIASPTSPSLLGTTTGNPSLDTLVSLDPLAGSNLIYGVAQDGDAFSVVSVASPSSPSVIGSLQDIANFQSPQGVAAFGSGYAIVGCGGVGNRVSLVDATSPSSPSVIASNTNAALDNVYDVIVVDDQYVYAACDDDDRIAVLEIIYS